jgi:hypothetical protein
MKPSMNVVEGRAKLARPSLRLLPVALVSALLGLAALAPAAQAVPFSPALTGTNPVSPGASLTPRIQGQADGVVTAVVHPRLSAVGGGPVAMAIEPTNTITIYTDPNCTGTVAGEGTADKLEKAGIEVEVAPESVTSFYATQSNGGGSSPCSTESVTYRQVSTAPGPPSFSSVNPASGANDNFPRLIGSADPEATVSIYMNASCTGQPLATGTGAVFGAAGIQVSVPDNSETTFYAQVSMAGFLSSCSSSSISYKEVTPPPPPPPSEPEGGSSGSGSPPAAPHLRTIPGGRANDNTPLVTGTAPGAATVKVFTSAGCKGAPVAKGSAGEFASGLEVQVADNTTTSFYGISVGSGGGQSACSTPVTYVEDSTAPHTRITMGPGAKTRKRSATFRFTDTTDDTPGTVFLCKVDRRKWKACGSPLRLRKLKLHSHTLRVKAIDPAGNAEATGAKRRFKVIRRP